MNAMTDNLIADSVGRLFAEQVDKGVRERAEAGALDAALWGHVVDAGLPGLTTTEAAGGLGQDWAAAFPVLRGLGHWQVPLPLAETMVAASLASMAGMPVPDGPLTLIELGRMPGASRAPAAASAVRVDEAGGAVRLTGQVHHVPWARHAVAALVALPDGRLGWLRAHGGGTLGDPAATGPTIQLTEHADVARLPSDSLTLEAAALSDLADNPTALNAPIGHLGAMARAAMMVGALESALAMAVGYAGERVQFGRPIGKFQAVQQNLALMAGDVAAARVAALVAAQDAPCPDQPRHPSAAFSIAVAKVRASEAATRGAGIAHQVHGAIGFTVEHGLHFATRRLWSWRESFGTDADWARELGRQAIAASADGFWPAVTRRQWAA